jgi:hypothetical protein
MKPENTKLIADVMEAVYAKDKLEEIERLVENTKSDAVSKQKLKDIINRADDPDGMV